ncbi:MAG: DUF1573 domain-containing protein [Bacteroidia bacterium]|nr:DUF1573 domain-containing protein [Bacteroidia bacterium]
MKKIALILVAVALVFAACQTANKAKPTANNEGTNNTTATTTTPNALPPTQNTLPEWQAKAASLPATAVSWAEEIYKFPEVTSGETVTHQFRFKNTGSEDLVLTRVKASCGCTTPSYSKDPIKPGEEGYIDVAFNTNGKKGRQVKTVTVTANMEGNTTKVLRIEGNVADAAPSSK